MSDGPRRARIEVPATCALPPGGGALAVALRLADVVTLDILPEQEGVTLASITGESAHDLDPEDNLLCRAYRRWGEDAAIALPGARFALESAIPPERGLGASAAAIVAGLAAGAFASQEKQPEKRLLALAVAMGEMPPTAAAAAIGGISTATAGGGAVHAAHIVSHLSLACVLFVPFDPLPLQAGPIQQRSMSSATHAGDARALALLAASLTWGSWRRLGLILRATPPRSYPAEVREGLSSLEIAAYNAGAYATCISGRGPTLLVLAPLVKAETVRCALEAQAGEASIAGRVIQTEICDTGVQIKKLEDEAFGTTST